MRDRATVDDLRIPALLALELWKTLRSFSAAVQELSPERARMRQAQIRYTSERLNSLIEEAGLHLAQFEGRPFTANLPADALNAEDFEGVEPVYVAETLEPAIVADGRVLHIGKVLLTGDPNVPGN